VLVAQHCWSSWCCCWLVLEQLVMGQLLLWHWPGRAATSSAKQRAPRL
jgi:hypothetical protein